MSESIDFYSLFGQPDRPPPNGTNGVAHPAAEGSTPYGERALSLEVEAVLAAPEGTRNDRLNVAAFNLGQLVPGGHLTRADVEDGLTLAGHVAGLTPTETAATIGSGIKAGMKQPRTVAAAPDPPPATVLPPEVDEARTKPFWASRTRLQALHDWAKARRASPWAVLGVTLARVVAATDHRIVIPPIVGGVASLNLFVGIVGVSGTGKGAAEEVAAEALRVDGFDTHKTGSGEGIAHSYMRRKGKDLEQHQTNCLFSVAEIDTLTALGQRQSATLMPELRSAWSGEALGFAYSDPAKRMPVPKHHYRLCLVTGIQPGRAGALLDESVGGTPQRFLWLPATDRDAPDVPPACPPSMTYRRPPWSSNNRITGQHRIAVAQVAVDTIDEARVARLRGEGHALDGHALLCRLKTAVALALLDERLEVTEDDWDLAGVVQDVSDRTRVAVQAVLSDTIRRTNEAKGLAEADRTVVVQERVAEIAAKRIVRQVVRALSSTDDGLGAAALRKTLNSRDRRHFNEALDRAVRAGIVNEVMTPHGVRYEAPKEVSA